MNNVDEKISTASILVKYVDRLDKNIEKLNDNFILHQQTSVETARDIKIIRVELLRWLKILGIIAFIAVGGTSVLKLIGLI